MKVGDKVRVCVQFMVYDGSKPEVIAEVKGLSETTFVWQATWMDGTLTGVSRWKDEGHTWWKTTTS